MGDFGLGMNMFQHALFDVKMETEELPDPDAIADAVLEAFDKLPPKCKPRPRSPGSREWIPLAGIVVAKGTFSLPLPFPSPNPFLSFSFSGSTLTHTTAKMAS